MRPVDDTLLGFNLHVSWGVPRSGPHVDFFFVMHAQDVLDAGLEPLLHDDRLKVITSWASV